MPPAANPHGAGETFLQSAAFPAEPMGFFTDTTVCIGCEACEVACKSWNGLSSDIVKLSGNSYDNTQRLSGENWRHVQFVEQFSEDRSTGRGRLAVGAGTAMLLGGCSLSPEVTRKRGEPGGVVGNHNPPVQLPESADRFARIFYDIPFKEPAVTSEDTAQK